MAGAPERLCIGNTKWFNAKQVGKKCEYANTKKAIKDHVPTGCKRTFQQLVGAEGECLPNLANSIYITESGVINLVVKSRKRASLLYAQALGIKTLAFKVETAELGTLGCMLDTFKGEEMIEQFRVGDYYIDLYFPAYKSLRSRYR